MKFVKGIIFGTIISASVAMICAETPIGRNKIMKKGRKIAKKMGIM